MAERIERDHPVAALGQGASERVVHAARQQQARDQDERPRAGAVVAVDEPVALVGEFAAADADHLRASITLQPRLPYRVVDGRGGIGAPMKSFETPAKATIITSWRLIPCHVAAGSSYLAHRRCCGPSATSVLSSRCGKATRTPSR